MWKVFIIWFVWNSGKVKLKYGKKKEKEGKGKGKEKQKQSGGLLEGQLTEKDHLEDWGTAGMPEILIVCSSSSRGLEMFYILIRVYSFVVHLRFVHYNMPLKMFTITIIEGGRKRQRWHKNAESCCVMDVWRFIILQWLFCICLRFFIIKNLNQ